MSEYQSFDRVADIYDSTRYVPPEILRAVARLVRADLGTTASPMLDAGVGTGRFAAPLSAEGLRTVGADVSVPMLRRAAVAAPRADLVRADLRSLPFRSQVFGGAIVVHILHLVPDWRQILRELRRALAPAGRLYLGIETGKHFRSRTIYFRLAHELGLNRPRPGAQSFDEILQACADMGAAVEQIDAACFGWNARIRIGDMIQTIHQNAFSHLWHVDPDAHALLAAKAERQIRTVFRSVDDVDEAPASIQLWRAEWPVERDPL